VNILFIMSDTFRRDHLGCYGNTCIHTPHLDQFAEMCVQFDNCYNASFPTMPNRADLLTGKFTFTYLGWNPLPRDERILSDLLAKAGYATVAVADPPFFIRNGYGYDRGFRDFTWIPGQHELMAGPRVMYERRYEEDHFAPQTLAAAERRLEYYYKDKFFLYVDTWDPHEPWNPPSWYVEPYYPGYDGREVEPCYWDWREAGVEEEDLKIAHACYCGEITMVDRWVGHLLEKVKAMGLWEDTAIVFTSDHGYFFGEHGFFGKAREMDGGWVQSPLYRELTRLPLLIYVPGVKPKRVKSLVSAVDIMPTLLELAGVQIPETVQGRSFVPLIKGEKNSFRDFVVSSFPLYNAGDRSRMVDGGLRPVGEPHFSAVTTSRWTFLYSTEAYPAQLYDIERDPKESKNVIEQNWAVAEDLHRKFVQVLEEAGTDEEYLAPRRRLARL